MVILHAWVKKANGTSVYLGTFLKVRKAVRAGEAHTGSHVVSFVNDCGYGEVNFVFYLENRDKITISGQ